MNSISLCQIKPLQLNQLFYIPKDHLIRQHNSKYIKLFKSNLHKQSPIKLAFSKNQQKNLPSKFSFIKQTLDVKSQQKANQTMSVLDQSERAMGILSQRQKLVKQIIRSGQINQTIKPRKRAIVNQRCKTLQNKEILTEQAQLQRNPNSSRKFKMPAKFRMTFSKNKSKSDSKSPAFPQLDNESFTPTGKKLKLSNLQVINKYRQFEQKYRSKQFLSIPISISSVTNSNRKKSQIHPQTSKINKNALLQSRNGKLKLSLESFSNQKFFQYSNPQNQLFLLNQEDQEKQKNQFFFSQLSVKNQKKSVKVKNKHSQFEIHHSNNAKLKQKQPLDDYFKPWQNNQAIKQQNTFHTQNYFN